jgi:hypothetical protein
MKIRALPGAHDGGFPSAVNVTNNGPVVEAVKPCRGGHDWLKGWGQSCAMCLSNFSAEAGLANASAVHPVAAATTAVLAIALRV